MSKTPPVMPVQLMTRLIFVLLGLFMIGCEEPSAQSKSSTSAKRPASAEVESAPKPKPPPTFTVDEQGPKVGWTRILVSKPDWTQRLERELTSVAEHIKDRDLSLKVDRKAKPEWVTVMLESLQKQGAKSLVVSTETRKEFPKKLSIATSSAELEVAPCSLVAMVLQDRGTAVWQLSGGTASKRRKGFAGPDLTTTAETIERRAKACRRSSTIFVSAAEGVEWGLVYDLAASTQKLEKTTFDDIVLLREVPVAGRPVKL